MTPEQIKELAARLRPFAHRHLHAHTTKQLLAMILHTLIEDAKQKQILLEAAIELAKSVKKEETKEIV